MPENYLTPPLRPCAACWLKVAIAGCINVNLIINQQGIWPLEFTSRFGYLGFAIFQALHTEPWHTVLRRMVKKDSLALPTRDRFAVGVVLTVPPFPYSQGYDELSKGVSVCFRPGLTDGDRAALHFAEVERIGGQLVTSGATGYVGVATGSGRTIDDAIADAHRIANYVVLPNLRYRMDIGHRVNAHDWQALRAMGWLGDDAPDTWLDLLQVGSH